MYGDPISDDSRSGSLELQASLIIENRRRYDYCQSRDALRHLAAVGLTGAVTRAGRAVSIFLIGSINLCDQSFAESKKRRSHRRQALRQPLEQARSFPYDESDSLDNHQNLCLHWRLLFDITVISTNTVIQGSASVMRSRAGADRRASQIAGDGSGKELNSKQEASKW